MFGIEKRLNSRIVSFFRRRGFDATIGRVKWRGGRLTVDDLFLEKTDTPGQTVRVKRIDAGLYLWRSFIHFAIDGGMKIEGVCCDLRFLSDTPLSLPSLDTAFRFRKKLRLLQLKAERIAIILKHKRNKTSDDLFVEIPEATWDGILNALNGHLLCPFITGSRSDSKISLFAFFRFFKNDSLPVSVAKIGWDGFHLNHKNPAEEPFKIDRDYLMDALDTKLGVVRNQRYTELEQMPRELVDVIICSEDPRYWSHSGVCLYGLGIALRVNAQTRKFARGASTITMQMVRNLFLNHNRTLVRKVEEAIIALLLENYYRIDKKTILELYLNLIEFAPGVHGVADASRFYFDKDVGDLSLVEMLTFTYIIPRPRHFYQALLDRTEQLQRNLRAHIRSYAWTMVKRGMISSSDEQGLDYRIRFSQQFGTLDLSQQV